MADIQIILRNTRLKKDLTCKISFPCHINSENTFIQNFAFAITDKNMKKNAITQDQL